MREIGVRELKRTLSETLRTAGQGELIRVTIRGRPLADIVPIGAAGGDNRLHQLVVAGRIDPPVRSRPDQAPRLATSVRLASELVLAERNVER